MPRHGSPPTSSGFAAKRSRATDRFALTVLAGSGATCWVVHTGAASDCRCDAAAPAGATCSGAARAIRSVALPSSERVNAGGNVGSIVFDPLHGTSTPTGTLRVVGARGAAVHHVVNVLGRVRSCPPEGAVPAIRPADSRKETTR